MIYTATLNCYAVDKIGDYIFRYDTIGYRIVALEIEDMDKAIVYLKSKGVEISMGPVNLGNSKRAYIKDPDGLSIELRQ